MKFTPPRLHEDQKSYPDGVTIKSDKYPETDYILKLLPQQHKLVVYHMSRQPADPARQKKADPLSASVVLLETSPLPFLNQIQLLHLLVKPFQWRNKTFRVLLGKQTDPLWPSAMSRETYQFTSFALCSHKCRWSDSS